MKRIQIKAAILICFLTAGQFVFGQSKQERAEEKLKQAIQLVDEGKIDEGIILLQDAQKLDPKNSIYPYELAYAYCMKKEYKRAVKYLEKLVKDKKVYDQVFQLLGNCYDYLGDPEKAIATYQKGLRVFPKSGCLHLEMGVMQLGKKDYDKALSYFEQGIEVDPVFPSNYYWAAKLYSYSEEELWGMIYGEIFMNLERNTRRTAEISKLLFDVYEREIRISGDSSSVSFSRNLILPNPQKKVKPEMPYGMTYETTLLLSLVGEKEIDINSLNRIRTNFLKIYFDQEYGKKASNVLFEYQDKIFKAGHFEAYNYWLLMMGDEEGFKAWHSENSDKMNSFIDWFMQNPLKLDEKNRFHRQQY